METLLYKILNDSWLRNNSAVASWWLFQKWLICTVVHVAKQVFVGSWIFKLLEKSNVNFRKETELVQNIKVSKNWGFEKSG